MTTNIPGPGAPMGYMPPDKDAEHLKILSILWWVVAGLQCLGFCGGVIYIVLGIAFASGNIRDPDAHTMGIVFSCLGVFILVISATMAFLSYLVGKSLRERRRLMLCYVMAGLMCISVPLGTALGIFTFIVLNRP